MNLEIERLATVERNNLTAYKRKVAEKRLRHLESIKDDCDDYMDWDSVQNVHWEYALLTEVLR